MCPFKNNPPLVGPKVRLKVLTLDWLLVCDHIEGRGEAFKCESEKRNFKGKKLCSRNLDGLRRKVTRKMWVEDTLYIFLSESALRTHIILSLGFVIRKWKITHDMYPIAQFCSWVDILTDSTELSYAYLLCVIFNLRITKLRLSIFPMWADWSQENSSMVFWPRKFVLRGLKSSFLVKMICWKQVLKFVMIGLNWLMSNQIESNQLESIQRVSDWLESTQIDL